MWIIKIPESNADLTLTALLEYFDLLAHALKFQNCYLFSYYVFKLFSKFHVLKISTCKVYFG